MMVKRENQGGVYNDYILHMMVKRENQGGVGSVTPRSRPGPAVAITPCSQVGGSAEEPERSQWIQYRRGTDPE